MLIRDWARSPTVTGGKLQIAAVRFLQTERAIKAANLEPVYLFHQQQAKHAMTEK